MEGAVLMCGGGVPRQPHGLRSRDLPISSLGDAIGLQERITLSASSCVDRDAGAGSDTLLGQPRALAGAK
jgi:hypothetical protein